MRRKAVNLELCEIENRNSVAVFCYDFSVVNLKQAAKSPIASPIFHPSPDAGEVKLFVGVFYAIVKKILKRLNAATGRTFEFPHSFVSAKLFRAEAFPCLKIYFDSVCYWSYSLHFFDFSSEKIA